MKRYWTIWMAAVIAVFPFLDAFGAEKPDLPPKELSSDEYNEITGLWTDLIDTDGQKRGTGSYLLRKGEAALEVLLDLVYGAASEQNGDKEIVALIADLGAADYGQRQSAQQALISMGVRALEKLEENNNHPDPEVRMRVRAILTKIRKRDPEGKGREKTLLVTTKFLEQKWPPDQLRSVVRRNLDRLRGIKTVEADWRMRPLGPLLAGLRYSDVRADRDLLKTFLKGAEEGAAEVALGVMVSGLGGRTRRHLPNHWKKLPEHDYGEIALTYLDARRPGVFREALYAAPRSKNLTKRLHAALSQTDNEGLKEEIYRFLWVQMKDPAACDFYANRLASSDDKQSTEALGLLTGEHYLDRAPLVIPRLARFLKGKNEKRKKPVLEALSSYRGREHIRLAAAAAAGFLTSTDNTLKDTARDVLLRLQNKGHGDVLKAIAENYADAEVRKAAIALKKGAPKRKMFVGAWKSSRIRVPHVYNIYEDGRWDIKMGGSVANLGGWHLKGNNILWREAITFSFGDQKPDKREDLNPILEVGPDKFRIRELDGSITTFTRIKKESEKEKDNGEKR
jgi:hypothetical protein